LRMSDEKLRKEKDVWRAEAQRWLLALDDAEAKIARVREWAEAVVDGDGFPMTDHFAWHGKGEIDAAKEVLAILDSTPQPTQERA
jgi:hypothetical protein